MPKVILIFLMSLCVNTQAKECVILLHGLARTSASMEKLETRLATEGYNVVNHAYASRKKNIKELAAEELPLALAKCGASERVNFVTHSLGGILLRQYLSTSTISNLYRVVMLGAPNKGSQVADTLKNVPGYKAINGPAGMQLGTDAAGAVASLGPVNFELGVIAGTKSINLILSTMLPDPDDGKVSVENAKIEGMTDFLMVPVSHPFLMKDPKVIRQVVFFLHNGRFSPQVEYDNNQNQLRSHKF